MLLLSTFSEEAQKNAYYIALSGLQKAIRRNDLVLALISAKVAHEIDPFRLFRRMHTIAFEDCSMSFNVLDFLRYPAAKHGFGSFKDWEYIRKFVGLMVKCPKTQEPCRFTYMGRQDIKYLPKECMDWAEQLFEYDDFECYIDTIDPSLHWVIDVCENGQKKYDKWEKCSCFIPYFVGKYGFAEDHIDRIIDEYSGSNCEDALIENLLYCSAIDRHTRPGAIALNGLIKKFGISMNRENLSNLLWVRSGNLLKKKISEFEGGITQWKEQSAEKDFGVPYEELYTKFNDTIFPKLAASQRWAMNKFQEEMIIFKEAMIEI